MAIRSERVIDYSVFLDGKEYLGTATANLPEITYLTETHKGGGINGEIEAPAPGQTGAMTLTLNWRTIERSAAALLAPKVHALDLRASIQTFDPASNEYKESALRMSVRVRPLALSLGNLEAATTMDTNNKFSISQIKVWLDNQEMLEIDKYNYIHKVNGVDYLEQTRKNLAF